MARPQKLFLTRIPGLSLLVLAGVIACSRDNAPVAAEPINPGDSTPKVQHIMKTDPAIARKVMKGEWRLVAIDERQLSRGGTPTVVFGDEGNCWGTTGINDFRTTFTLEGPNQDRVKVGPAAVTRKAGPPEAMAVETLFLERFESANAYKVDGDVLYLHSGEDQNLTFQRVEH